MAEWVQCLLSIASLTSYPLLTEGLHLPLQQIPPPAQETELDQCEFQGYEYYEEQCGSETVRLPSCNPGEKRVWWCNPKTGLPDDFALDETYICQNCPEGSFQKWYNKCGTCHPCTVCGEGETEEKACEMEEDTKCAKVSTVKSGTESLPMITTPSTEGPLNPTETALPLNPSSESVLTDEVTLETETANQTAPPMEPAVEPIIDNPQTCCTTFWFCVVVALAMFFASLPASTSIGWCREWLKGRKPQPVNQDDFPLNLVNSNGNVPHDNENRDHAEGDPLLGAKQQSAELDIPVRGDATHAIGPLAVDGIQHTKGPSDVVVDLGVGGRCDVTSEGAPCVGGDGSTGGASGTATDEGDDGWNNHAHSSTSDVEEQGAEMIPDGTCGTRNTSRAINLQLDRVTSCSASDDGTGCSGGTMESKIDVLSPSDGQVVDIPDETRAAATEHPCDDTNIVSNLPVENATTPNGDDEANSKAGNKPGETLVDGSLPPDDHAKLQGTPNAKTTSASSDCLIDFANSDCAAASHEVDEDSIPNESTVGSKNGHMDSVLACGHPYDNPGVDAREPNNAPEQIKPEIQADDVVTTQFLQHVAREVPHIKIKEICRMPRLQERDINNIEALNHKGEQGFEFLKRLLRQVANDLTY